MMPFCHVRTIVPTYKIHDLNRFSSTGQSQKVNNSVNMRGLTMSSALVCVSDIYGVSGADNMADMRNS